MARHTHTPLPDVKDMDIDEFIDDAIALDRVLTSETRRPKSDR